MSKFKPDDDKMIVFIDQIKEMIDILNKATQESRLSINGEYYLTNKELGELLKISRRTLQRYRSRGLVPYYILNGKVLYRESDIQEWLEKHYLRTVDDTNLV